MRKVFYILFFISFLFTTQNIFGQAGVFDQNDPDVVFTSSNQPPPPPWDQLSKWGHTNRLGWNPYSYGYKSYYFHGMAFRLKFPKTYQQDVVDGKKYPLFLFLHGKGEVGTIYDNELQLIHGGQAHAQAVDNDTYDGFLLYPQSSDFLYGGYLNSNFGNLMAIMDSLIKYCKLDQDRVVLGGLSSGGQSTWDFLESNPERWARVTPISAARANDSAYIPNLLSIPVWTANGGQDQGPYPSTVTFIVNFYRTLGGDIKQSFYPLLGHGVWNNFWAEPGYFDYLATANKTNPMVFFQHNEFCPNDAVDAKMIVQSGFYAYEWQKNGVTIPGAITDSINVFEFGTYRARFKRKSTSTWSDWSPEPVVISIKDATLSPPIQIDGLHTNVLPAPDGSTTVPLIVPNTYASYDWRRVSDNAQVSTLNTLTAPIGQYKVQVTEPFGCSSSYSPIFSVISASGINVPDKATDLTAVTISNTSIDVYWNNNPSPLYNETAFEVYRSITSGSGYKLIAIIPADILGFVDEGLLPNTKYFYTVRAINNNGAAPLSNEANETTKSDSQSPSAPGNLIVTGTTRHSVSLSWDPASDDVGVAKYDVYVNGQKAFVTNLTQYTVNNLDSFTTFSFYVRAKDLAGNVSVPSNQVSGFTKFAGLNYKYYEGSWTVLPDFNALTPIQTGTTPNVDISGFPKTEYYGILWQGYIRIPVTGTYKFETGSDDGSKLYINTPYSFGATPLVNNDGSHGIVYAGGNITLNAGLYPIAITFFQGNGGQGMGVYWTCAAAGFPTRTAIPSAYFGDNNVGSGTLPIMPSNLVVTPVSYYKAHLTWTDGSSNETGFEIYRKGPSDIDFVMIGLRPANTNSFDDTLLLGGTTYSYKIQSVNNFGASGFNSADLSGVNYNYYQGDWNNLPDFTTLTSLKSGNIPNYSLNPRLSEDFFAFKYSAVINIPTAGTYTFYTTSDDGSKLYLDNFTTAGLVVNNDYLQGATERSGTKNFTTAGPHNIYVTYFEKNGGQSLEVRYQGPSIAKQLIPDAAFINSRTTITTPAAPAIPAVPKGLTLQTLSSKMIQISFRDSSTQTGYEIQRSLGTPDNFRLFKLLNIKDSIVSLADTSLYANTTYYYKVRALGISGNSAFTNYEMAATSNNKPILVDVQTFAMYYGSTKTIPLTASDVDGDILTFSFIGMPSFGVFNSTTNGQGNIVLTPNIGTQGVFPMIVYVNDGHNGKDTISFTITVNANHVPVISRARDITVNEGATDITSISSTDADRRSNLKWTIINGPSFMSLRENGTGVSVYSQPGYADAGVHPVTLSVTDGDGGEATINFNIIVNDVAPVSQKVYINLLNSGNAAASLPWNNMTTPLVTGLLDNTSQITSIGVDLGTVAWNTFNLGAVTGNNSGIYPDAVIRDYYFFGKYGAPDTIYMKATGLTAGSKYNITFFASSTFTTGSTVFANNGVSKTINFYNNSQNAVTFYALVADGAGQIPVKISKALGTEVGYFNSIVIEKPYDDGTKPVAPLNFAATAQANAKVLLTWVDKSYNEDAFQILRSLNAAGSYTLLNSGQLNANDVNYTDSTGVGNTTYFYKITAKNGYGNSDTSMPVSVFTTNKLPIFNAINNIYLRSGSSSSFNITATDDAGEVLQVSMTGAPSFGVLQNTGNGTASVTFTPQVGDEGFYKNITITVTDNHGGSVSKQFSASVSDNAFRSVYLNFSSQGGYAEPAPWNNYLSYPFANATVSNMTDDANINTGFSFKFLQQLNGNSNFGMTANNNGILPDGVMQTSVYTYATGSATMEFNGLNSSKKYNAVIFCNLNAGSDDIGTFTSGGQSVTINGKYNTTKTVQLNNLTPNASGVIDVSFSKSLASEYLNINAVILQEYTGTPLLRPADLFITPSLSKTSVSMTWSDRSFNENGFQIWRATSLTGTYTLVSTTATNATTYTDITVLPGIYYYKVRAKITTPSISYSAYSNIAKVYVASSIVLLNLNANVANHQALPWNNTDDAPSLAGTSFDNLTNTDLTNTGISMEITKDFNGVGFAGINGTGVFPANVMSTNYWTDSHQTSELKFENVDQRKNYRVGVFTSVDKSGYFIGRYAIGKDTIAVNGYINNVKIIYFTNVKPDENGEIYVSVIPDVTSPYCFTSAVTLESYDGDGEEQIAQFQMPDEMLVNNQTPLITNLNVSPVSVIVTSAETKDVVNVFPNPFVDQLQVNFATHKNVKKLGFLIYDINSRLVAQKFISGNGQSYQSQSFTMTISRSIAPGSYILKVTYDDVVQEVIKLIKVK